MPPPRASRLRGAARVAPPSSSINEDRAGSAAGGCDPEIGDTSLADGRLKCSQATQTKPRTLSVGQLTPHQHHFVFSAALYCTAAGRHSSYTIEGFARSAGESLKMSLCLQTDIETF